MLSSVSRIRGPTPVSARPAVRRTLRASRATSVTVTNKAALQFIKGVEEPVVPEVKLTRSKDGASGTAMFIFKNASIFQTQEELGDITGMYMVDEEGELSTVDVNAMFVGGKPDRIEAKYIMRSSFEWDRFMRFMERYAEEQELGFQKS